MKRSAGKWMLLAAASGLLTAVGGCMQLGKTGTFGGNGPSVAGSPMGACAAQDPQIASNTVGPWGQPVIIPDAAKDNPADKKPSLLSHLWPGGVQQASCTTSSCAPGAATNGGILQVSGKFASSGGMPPSAGMPVGPGMPPGGGMTIPPNAVAAVGALTGGMGAPFTPQRTEVRFLSPAGMKVSWYAPSAGGKGGFAAESLGVPGRYNFVQGAIYRLKLNGIPGNVNDYYPTLEVVPTTAKTAAFLAHSSVPVSFTQEDFEQVDAGNLLVKVIYLPDREFQDIAATGPYEVVSTRLEPGVDPIHEACRRGSILCIVRLGNINLEAAGTPAMDAPPAYGPAHGPVPPPPPPPAKLPNAMMMPPSLPPAQGGTQTISGTTTMAPAELAGQPGPSSPVKRRSWLSSLSSGSN
jgi:hypothetical protein